MENMLIVVGMDDSEPSFYALEWTLDQFFSSPEKSPFRLVVVHAKPTSGELFTAGNAAEGPLILDRNLASIGGRVLKKAKEICDAKSVKNALFELVEGDARSVLCEVVESLDASILVVGSHGYGAIRRAVLGSVSDYCAHHAQCSVMIVKRPMIKN